jgi:hypothetical protein
MSKTFVPQHEYEPFQTKPTHKRIELHVSEGSVSLWLAYPLRPVYPGKREREMYRVSPFSKIHTTTSSFTVNQSALQLVLLQFLFIFAVTSLANIDERGCVMVD